MQKLFIILLLNIWVLNSIHSQCNIENNAFKGGEVVTYHAYYNWHFIWINAGIVHFSVEDRSYDDKDTWFLSAYGKTYPSYDKFMVVRDTFETYVDKATFNTLAFNRVTKEGSTESHHQYKFDYHNNQITTRIAKEGYSNFKDSLIDLQPCASDLLNMVYKARNIDYSDYKAEDKIPIAMIVDGKIHDLYIRYQGKEEITTRDGRVFRCLKFTPLLVEGTIFASGEGMSVWVTDDENRIPIVVEAKIMVGSVKAVFVDVKNPRHPITAEVL